jgi:RnfABCDGE-type electron transport complex B subunit
MLEISTATGIMLGVATFFGVVLAVAHRWLHVEEDPRIDRIESGLPGSNCGACGQPGCRAFAEALVRGDEPPARCTVSSPDVLASIAALLGVDVGSVEKQVARLHCAGGRSSVRRLAEYHGIRSCRAAFVVNGGGRACPWGCLGLGDCERACSFDAIRMNDEDLPVVDVNECTACNDCVEVCPLDLFTLEPLLSPLVVQCRCPLPGEAARSLCTVACDACGRCAVDAPEGAVVMASGLPQIRDASRTTAACTRRCPTGAIQWVVGAQFRPPSANDASEGTA